MRRGGRRRCSKVKPKKLMSTRKVRVHPTSMMLYLSITMMCGMLYRFVISLHPISISFVLD